MPISVSDTHGLFTLRDTQEPIAPDTEITERKIGFNATFNANLTSFTGLRSATRNRLYFHMFNTKNINFSLKLKTNLK
jgi:hypothetical protein